MTSTVTTKRAGRIAATAAIATMGALIVNVPAYANDTVKSRPNASTVVFTTSDSGSNGHVTGNVTFTVRADGNWTMDSHTHNSHIAWRNVTWRCTLLFGPSHTTTTYTIGRHRVDGKESSNRHAGAYDADIQRFFGDVYQYGQATCDLSVG
ncbi:hypothetical protein J4573_10985 [Actinomadura barringtoniae]|uniref:Uncharacterized protein n=1 Tax=Actinomadura barringtoniae TaxID=1427535 RepID=A0A939P8F9_9ACTN|nr:hypothetical protein [Actinomadura barringtoniae]MBO2447613.1 hypothetical protein [Actinomadura barringtoniae]